MTIPNTTKVRWYKFCFGLLDASVYNGIIFALIYFAPLAALYLYFNISEWIQAIEFINERFFVVLGILLTVLLGAYTREYYIRHLARNLWRLTNNQLSDQEKKTLFELPSCSVGEEYFSGDTLSMAERLVEKNFVGKHGKTQYGRLPWVNNYIQNNKGNNK